MEESNEKLVTVYQSGEEKAFAELTRRTLPAVYSFVLRFVGDKELAQDIVQETYIKAWSGLKTYDAKKSQFMTWLMRIARNTAVDHLRKKKQVPFSQFDTAEGKNVLEETVADEAPLADALMIQKESSQTLNRAVAALPSGQREVLLLHYNNRMTFGEISQVLKLPENTVRSRHHRAVLSLRSMLQGEMLGAF